MDRSDLLAAIAVVVSLASFAVSCWLSVRLQSRAHKFQKKMFRVKSIHNANAKLADKVAEFDALSEIRREQLTDDQLLKRLQHLSSLFEEITSIYFANLHLFTLKEDNLIERHLAELQARKRTYVVDDAAGFVDWAVELVPIQRQVALAILDIFQKNLVQILPEMDEIDE